MTQHFPDFTFKVALQSSEFGVRAALTEVLRGLGPLSLETEELGTVELVLAEALNNVVEHAYPEGDPAGPIHIECSQSLDGLHFRVTDAGRPMPDGQIPLGQRASLDVDFMDLPEGGFGWFLIQDLAKDIGYRREDGNNILDLRLALAKAA